MEMPGLFGIDAAAIPYIRFISLNEASLNSELTGCLRVNAAAVLLHGNVAEDLSSDIHAAVLIIFVYEPDAAAVLVCGIVLNDGLRVHPEF